MLKVLSHFLLTTPVIALFLALALGYYVGKFRLKSFSLGSTVGVLLVALLIGQVGPFKIDPLVKSIFFDLFIFIVGYEVGPAFIRSLKNSGLKLVVQALFFSVVGFSVAFGLFKWARVDAGEGAGILAGALTQSATIGTASAAIAGLNVSATVKTTLTSQVAIAYAVTYVFGAIGVVLFVKNIAPALLHIDLPAATKKASQQANFRPTTSTDVPLLSRFATRAVRVNNTPTNSLTIEKLQQHFPRRLVVQQLFQADQTQSFTGKTRLQPGMILTVVGDSQALQALLTNPNLQEVFNSRYQQWPVHTAEVVLTSALGDQMRAQLQQQRVLIVKVLRNNSPLNEPTPLQAGDRVTLAGPAEAVKRVVPQCGNPLPSRRLTDVSYLFLGIIAGLLLGTLVLTIQGVPITLGAGGGALISGLVCGWYHHRQPLIGQVPAATCWFLKSVGLNLFIAAVGLEAGSQFVSALKTMGPKVLLIGAVVTLAPHLLTLLFGHFVLKLDPVENLGSLAGAGTSNPALNGLTEETGSSIFALSFTPTYALGNIFITVMGPLIVALLAR